MKFVVVLLATLPVAALAQGVSTAPPPGPSLGVAAREFEPALYCLYGGQPYSRGSRLYQAGFAMSCEAQPGANAGFAWQPVK